MSLTALQEQRGRLVTQAREALDEIKSNTDESRATELDQRHDTIMGELDALDVKIAREERVAKAEREQEEARAKNRPDQSGEGRGQANGAQTDYRHAFHAMIQAGGDLSELSPEVRAVLKAGVTPLEGRAQSTSNTAGGYTVPVELQNYMEKALAAWGPMYDSNICTVINTASGNQMTVPTVDDTTTALAKHTENTALTDDGGVDVTFGQKTLDAYAYDTEWVRFSYELAQDSIFNVEQLLGELLGERIARRVNTELTTGDGTGDPNGIVTASAAGKTAASATALASDEIIDLLHSVNPAYRASPKVRWMFNDTTLAAIRKLKDGQNNYLWQMGDIRTGEPGSLLGYSYSINQAMASPAASAKPIIFGDFSKYWVRKVGSPVLGVRREYYWPDLGIAGIVRLDGELLQTAAVKHLVMAAS